MSATLDFSNVTRRYGDVVALNRLSLKIKPGITAMVGPNGSGKSTFMRLATGHVKPTAGTITAWGQTVWDNPDVLKRIGYVPEQDAFYNHLTGFEFVRDMAILSGQSHATAEETAHRELDALGLGDARHRKIKTYSKGMRQRAKLAQALVNNPDLLLLDEPMLGCDPIARKRITERIHQLAREGKSVLVSTHILPEVAQMTKRIAVLVGGRLIATGDANLVRDSLSNVPSRIRVFASNTRAAAADLAAWPEVDSVAIKENAVELQTPALRQFLLRLHQQRPASWKYQGHETMDADLESIFGYLSGGN